MASASDKNGDKKLPNKESALFRSIVRCYEMKQYKKGLKAADQILRKFSEHGETLSMKGLILNCLDRKQEAYDLVRKGLRNDLRSHVCWHVYGLLYRSDGDYAEAIKCYRNALRIDPENMQILRDMALLQVQKRDLKGFTETRRQQLTLKPNNRNHWIGFAVSHHLVQNYDMAINILDAYINTLDADRKPNYDDSEMMLYKYQILTEWGHVEEAKDFLEKSEQWIVDQQRVRKLKADVLAHTGEFDQAEAIYRELLDVNSENFDLHRGLQCCILKNVEHIDKTGVVLPAQSLELGDDERERLTEVYLELHEKHPKSLAYNRIPLHFVGLQHFSELLASYMKKQLSRGVPALGSELKYFYGNEEKVSIIHNLIEEIESSLTSSETLPGSTKKEAPSTLLWTWYLAAQHFDRLGQHEKALEYIDRCIDHTPTLLDFYQRKGRILKHAGDIHAAATLMDFGRRLDLQDRYINNKTTEYLLQADRNEEADITIALFTRHEGDPQTNLYEMQCMWYELESGKSFFRQKMYGKALKKFAAVEKHFLTFVEDQFDFHSYCLRKSTLRSYVDMIRFADKIYGHRFFKRAAEMTIRTYLHLFDHPISKGDKEEESLNGLSTAERKLAKAKARKEALKKKKEAEAREREAREKAEREKQATGKDGKRRAKREAAADPDPDGEQLLSKDPLAEAWRVVSLLQEYAKDDLTVHLMAYDIAWRKKKILLCLQALKRAMAMAPNDADVIKRVVEFFVATEGSKGLEDEGELHPVVAQVLEEEKNNLLGRDSIQNFLKRVQRHTMQGAGNDAHSLYRAAVLLKAESLVGPLDDYSTKKFSELMQSSSADVLRRDLNTFVALHNELSGLPSLSTLASEIYEMGKNIFPYAKHFGGAYPLDTNALEGLSTVGTIGK